MGNEDIRGRLTSKKQRKIPKNELQKTKKQYRHGKIETSKESYAY